MAEERDRHLAIWAKAVDTQMHFNEMSVKSRQLGLTFVAAALGVAIVLLSRGDDFALFVSIGTWTVQVHIAVILLVAAAIALIAVRGLDLGVYHRMLRGAVTFGEDFEENYMKSMYGLDKGMTQAISHFSRFDDAAVKSIDGKYKYTGEIRRSAEDKIKEFYRNTMLFLWVAAIALLLLTNVGAWQAPAGDRIETDPAVPESVRPN
jgi:hypothetical protein